MSDTVEKIYCTPDSGSSVAETMALMNGGCNNWMNNPFMYLIWLAFFGGGNGFGYGKGATQDSEIMSRLNNIQSQMTDNHANQLAMDAIMGNGKALTDLAGNLNVGVATLGSAIASIKGAIDLVGAQNGLSAEKVINSILLGNKDLTQLISTCCCENKQLITTMGYEGQLRDQANTAAITSRIDQLANGVLQGFATTAYETAQQTNQLSRDLQGQTQTIIDKLASMESAAQQDKINSLTAQLTAANSRAERAAELAPIISLLNAIKAGQPATTTVQYPQLTVFPSYLNTAALQGYYGGSGFWS